LTDQVSCRRIKRAGFFGIDNVVRDGGYLRRAVGPGTTSIKRTNDGHLETPEIIRRKQKDVGKTNAGELIRQNVELSALGQC
jgi:hypothetical protein